MSRRALLIGAVLVGNLALAACGPSPNRGVWAGDFDGSLSGVVTFEINTRGTALTGTFEGETSDGAPFAAEMEGKVRGEDFYASFEGKGRAAVYSVPFEGFMTGRLGAGRATGTWEAEIRGSSGTLQGTWRAEQQPGSATED